MKKVPVTIPARVSRLGRATVDSRLRFLFVNPWLAHLSGKPAAFHRRRTLRKSLPFLASSLEPLLKRVIRTGRPVTQVKIRGQRRLGRKSSDVWLVSCTPDRDLRDKVQQDRILLQPVHELEQARERRLAENKFRQVVEAISSAIVLADAKGTILMVNAQTERLFGYPRAEIVGQSIDLLFPQRWHAAYGQHRAHLYAKLSPRLMGAGRDLYGLRKDGTEIPIEIGLNPIETEKGVQMLASIVDITDRKREQIEEADIIY
jgi:PAS domain S-box-containing protein